MAQLKNLKLDQKPNTNPFVDYFLTQYSQSKTSNKGTRGLDEFSRATYINTKLDEELRPKILQGLFRLVIISGNAGDGKTAFIQKMEEEARASCSEFVKHGNGCKFIYNGLEIHTNYDGSQDEGNIQSDSVLEQFFREFKGNYAPTFNIKLTKIIAINQGRLYDFLQSHRDQYDWFYKLIEDYVIYDIRSPIQDICIVNLNERALVDNSEESRFSDSIFDKLLNEFTSQQILAPCESCNIKDKCYIKNNIDLFRDQTIGKNIRTNLKKLIAVAHFRGQIHITMRDLRSALSYILFNISNCDEIHELLKKDTEEFLTRMYYNASFCGFEEDPDSNDRLLHILSRIDVSRVSNPKLDSLINFSPTPLQMTKSKDRFDIQLLKDIEKSRPLEPLNQTREQKRKKIIYHKSRRRIMFFEGHYDQCQISSADMLPYERYQLFTDIMNGKGDITRLRNSIIHAISVSEGIYNDNLSSNNLCIRINKTSKPEVKSFYLYDTYDFNCVIRNGADKAFIEYTPNSIIFEQKSTGFRLAINLDLFEMLFKIIEVYSPTLNEMRGPFLNLLMFKRQLTSTSSDRLVITENDIDFYEVKRIGEKMGMRKLVV